MDKARECACGQPHPAAPCHPTHDDAAPLVQMLTDILQQAKAGRITAFACSMTYEKEDQHGCVGHGLYIPDDCNLLGLLGSLAVVKEHVLRRVQME